ncbi:MAG: protein kinase [Myxococcales bacterium]|nr:protein kinase [Myxococcales bacterium]
MSGDDDRPELTRPSLAPADSATGPVSLPAIDSGAHPMVDVGAAPTLVSASSMDGDELDAGPPDDEHPPEGFGSRYADLGLLGRGGMGEVRLARDQTVGRRVALKVIRHGRAHRPRSRARFMREARIQGQLEHPAVVPVYDISETPDGRPYFTMKRVSGVTLEEVITSLRKGTPEAKESYSRRRLLEAFARVCLTVDYVHHSGVLHRDLKPANVMLGRFGEVYLLDWGLAKLFRDEEDEPLEPSPDGPEATTLDDHDGRTAAGELMGTPGYMAPEQIDAGGRPLDERADIYSLGAILFELLTYEPLHPRGPIQRKLGSTIRGADARAHERFPQRDVPPELESICVRATADEPDARYPSARALAEAVEAFLDGDRDLTLRREIARRWATRAEKAAEDAIESGNLEARSRALEHASRALALDPNDERARASFVRLLLEPPRSMPSSAVESLLEADRAAERVSARGGAIGYGAWLLFLPLLMWMGVRDWGQVIAMVGCVLVAFACSLAAIGHPRPEAWARPVAFVAGIGALMLLGRMCGPLVLVPGLAATNTAAVVVHAPVRRRVFYLLAAAAAVLMPLSAELVGLLPTSYHFVEGTMTIMPQMVELPGLPTMVFLVTATLTAVVVPPLLLARTRDGLRVAERQLAVHAWQMEQLLPRAARPLVSRSSEGA